MTNADKGICRKNNLAVSDPNQVTSAYSDQYSLVYTVQYRRKIYIWRGADAVNTVPINTI